MSVMPGLLPSIAILVALSACSGNGDGTSGQTVDAGPAIDAPNPYGLTITKSDVDILNVHSEYIFSIAQNEEGTKLAYCTVGGILASKVAFVDTESFTILNKVDLNPMSDAFAYTSQCKITTIGDYAYAFFQPNSAMDNPEAVVVKMSYADNSVQEIWQVPDMYYEDTWTRTDDTRQGVQATGDPNIGLLMTSRSRARPGLPDGISSVKLNLTTGEFSDELLVPGEPVASIDLYAVIGTKLFGLVRRVGAPQSTQFLVDIETKEVIWEKHLATPVGLTVNQEREQLLITGTPSSGWQIYDAISGNLFRSYEYITGGFSPYAVWIPNSNRIVHMVSGSNGNASVTIVNEVNGGFVANIIFKLELGFGPSGLAVSPDGKYIYLGGSDLVRVTIPDTL